MRCKPGAPNDHNNVGSPGHHRPRARGVEHGDPTARETVRPRRADLPAWAYILFFFVIPIALIFWYSLGYKPDLFTTYATDQLSLSRYSEALGSEYRSIYTNTLGIALTGTILALIISIPFAYWLAVKAPAQWRPLLLAGLMIPFWTNFLVRTVGWQITLAPTGWLSNIMQSAGGEPLGILYTRTAVQIGVVYNYLPMMILPLYVAMDRAGPALRQASRDLGAGRVTTFFRITLPLASPGIVAACLLVFIPLMGDYVTPQVLGGAQGAMAGQLIASQFNTAQNWALGSAMTMVMITFVILCVLIAALLFKLAATAISRWVTEVPLPSGDAVRDRLPSLPPISLRPARSQTDWLSRAQTACAIAVYLFLFLPILVIIAYSFNTGRVLASFEGFGFDAYVSALQNPVILRAVAVSLQVAVLSALLATILGGLAGIGLALAKKPTWWSIGLTAVLTITLVTPDIANAIAFLPWFVTLGVDAGIAPFNIGLVRLVIAHTAISLVVVTFIVRARVKGLDPALNEAAADLYAKPSARMRHVILPAATPGLIAGGLLAFTFSLDDVVISSFVQQPGYTPWPVYIFSSVRVALRPEVAAISTLMLLLTLAIIGVVALILRRSGESLTKMIG